MRCCIKGLYPAVYHRELHPSDWYASYLATYVERDVRQVLGVRFIYFYALY